jgi:hypothetical protein
MTFRPLRVAETQYLILYENVREKRYLEIHEVGLSTRIKQEPERSKQ